MSDKQKIPLAHARQLAQEIVELLAGGCARIEIAGSVRREKATTGDLEIVAQPTGDALTLADDLLASGTFTKRHAWGARAKFGMYKGVPFDLFVSLPSDRQFACTYWLRTGSAEANRLMVTQWHKGGVLPDTMSFCAEQFWTLPEPIYNLDAGEFEQCKERGDLTPLGGEILLTPEERDIFALVDLPFIPPQHRDERTYKMLAGRPLVSFHDIAHLWDERAGRWLLSDLIYIGREMPNVHMPRSKWANPFRITQDTPENRASAIEQYRPHIESRIASGDVNLDELRGKTLVCWCADHDNPKPCHGDVLLELLGNRRDLQQAAAPTQLTMFGGSALLDMEHRAAIYQEAQGDTSGNPRSHKRIRDEERFDWQAPWLDSSGQVWIYAGYGSYELLDPASPRAAAYLGQLRSLDYKGQTAHRWHLNNFLLARERAAESAPLAVARPVIAKPKTAISAPIKALSLWNPWAMFVMRGLKQNETRHWQTSYRGKLVIHAAKRWTNSEKEWLEYFIEELNLDVSTGSPYWSLMHETTYFGVALGTVELVDIISTNVSVPKSKTERMLGDYSANRYWWKFENPQLFEQPIPCAGRQSLWDWKAA